MERNNSYDDIMNSYFVSPWQPPVNVKKILEQPKKCLKEFVKNVIEKDIEEEEKTENKSEEHIEYINKVKKEIKKIKWKWHLEKMKKKLNPYEYALLDKNPPMDPEEEREEYRKKLAKELGVGGTKFKFDKI